MSLRVEASAPRMKDPGGIGALDSTVRERRAALETARVLEVELRARLAGEVRFDKTARMLYSTDASNYQIEPVGVVIPKTLDDVQATVELAASHG
ncbi:MAG: hypothetical protein C4345_01275, partial [Chloroflexota bacterium]